MLFPHMYFHILYFFILISLKVLFVYSNLIPYVFKRLYVQKINFFKTLPSNIYNSFIIPDTIDTQLNNVVDQVNHDTRVPLPVPPSKYSLTEDSKSKNTSIQSQIRNTVVGIRSKSVTTIPFVSTTSQQNKVNFPDSLDCEALHIYKCITSFDTIVDKALGTFSKHAKKYVHLVNQIDSTLSFEYRVSKIF